MNNSERFFANRECKYYPCHKMEEGESLNCLFCYCPLYHLEHCPGKHEYREIRGRMLKICTDCTFPHRADNYDTVIAFLKK